MTREQMIDEAVRRVQGLFPPRWDDGGWMSTFEVYRNDIDSANKKYGERINILAPHDAALKLICAEFARIAAAP